MACDKYFPYSWEAFHPLQKWPFFIASLSSGNKTLSTNDYYVGGLSPVLEIPLMVISKIIRVIVSMKTTSIQNQSCWAIVRGF